MKRYIALDTNNTATHIKIETSYNLGGLNVFTGSTEARGYYLSVSPVSRENKYGVTMETYTGFSGIKKCVKSVSRQSKKAAEQAEENALNYIHDLVLYVCNKNGLPVPAEFIAKEEETA